MNDRISRKINSYKAIERVEEQFLSTITSIPALSEQFNLFKDSLNTLNIIINRQTTDYKGYAEQKKVARNTLTDKAIVICKPLKAFASKTNNYVLEEEINYSLTDLVRAKEADFMDIVHRISVKADENATALANYGITVSMITELQNSITSLNSLRSKPREAIGIKKVATADLISAIRNTDNILKMIDKIIVIFKDSLHQFYGEYLSARKIIDIGSRKIMLKGKIKDSATGSLLRNALIELIGTTHSCFSSKRGVYAFKSLKPGNYTIRVSLKNYNSFEQINIPVNAVKTLQLNINLVKIQQQIKSNPDTKTTT